MTRTLPVLGLLLTSELATAGLGLEYPNPARGALYPEAADGVVLMYVTGG